MSADSDMVERLQSLASALGAGGLNETDPAKLLARVEWGVDHIQQIEAARSAQVVEELSKQPRTTRDEVKKAIPARAALDASGIGELVEALEKCRDKFAEYVELHAVKLQGAQPTYAVKEIEAKVARNQAMVDLCDAALSHARATVEKGDG